MALGLCRFTNAAGGLVNWTYPGPAIDMQSPAAAGAVNGTVYQYYAQSLDMAQWEIGTGAYTASTGVFARTTVLSNSLGTTAKISFLNPPQVAVFDRTTVGQVPGIASNTAATAGNVGEVLIASGTSVALTSGVTANLASLSLTPGDWDISSQVQFVTSGSTTVTDYNVAISLTPTSLSPVASTIAVHERVPAALDHSASFTISPAQALVSTATSYFLNVSSVFTGTAVTVSFVLRARRMR